MANLRNHWNPGPAAWHDDLAPLPASEWNYDRAAHLLDTPAPISSPELDFCLVAVAPASRNGRRHNRGR